MKNYFLRFGEILHLVLNDMLSLGIFRFMNVKNDFDVNPDISTTCLIHSVASQMKQNSICDHTKI